MSLRRSLMVDSPVCLLLRGDLRPHSGPKFVSTGLERLVKATLDKRILLNVGCAWSHDRSHLLPRLLPGVLAWSYGCIFLPWHVIGRPSRTSWLTPLLCVLSLREIAFGTSTLLHPLLSHRLIAAYESIDRVELRGSQHVWVLCSHTKCASLSSGVHRCGESVVQRLAHVRCFVLWILRL